MSQAEQTPEWERTFLARLVPVEVRDVTPVRLLDVYIPVDSSVHPRLRLRRSDDTFSLTKKLPSRPGDASAHDEQTIPLSQEEFDCMAQVSDRRIHKERYTIELDGNHCDVDVFSGGLEGLVLMDFEFESEVAKNTFVPPEVCLAEVTQEDFIAGGLLAGRTIADIQPELDRFTYKSLEVQR